MMLASLGQAQDNHIPLKADGHEVSNDMAEKGIHYFKITFGDDLEENKDLLLNVIGKTPSSDPDLHISSTNKEPKNMQDSEFSCAMVGEDICTIPASQLRRGKTFYIAVKCYRACSYDLVATMVSEIELKGRKDYTVPVKGGDKRIFTFAVEHPGIHDLLFTARASSKTASIRMYLKEGKDSVPTSSDIKSNDGWEDGVVIRLTSKEGKKITEGLVYKLLLEADDDTTVTMRVDMLYSEKMIDENVAYEDFVNYNERTCYKYMVRSSDKKLRIGAYSFSGNPDIYVHPETNPAQLSDFKFKATEPSDDVLVITPEDRRDAGVKKGIYYICIVGHSNTSYRLKVAESDQDYFLEDGIAETNEVASGKETTFYFTDASLIRDLNLTFTLSVKSGPRPDMYVKFCGRAPEGQCIIGSKSDPNVLKATSEIGTLFTFINHKGKDCMMLGADQTNPCVYIIEVSAPKETSGEKITHFSLVAHHTETSHIRLREGLSVEQIVENHQVRYFEFVVRDSLATSVSFTLNSHHGDADIYVSRTNKYPDNKNFEKKSARSRRFADEVTYEKNENDSLLGVYYIAVQGFEYSSFSLRATIVRGADTEKIVPVEIREGILINEIVADATQKKYFQFKTSMYGNFVSDIKVTVTPISGEFDVFVKSGSFPSETDYDYNSTDGNDIIMKTKDKKFQPVGMKFVLVKPKSRYGQSISQYRFSIKYTTVGSISELKKDVPSFGSVTVGSFNYYKYLSIEKGSDLTISLTPLSGDANLVVSVNSSSPYPNLSTNDYHSKEIGMDSITLRGNKLFDKNPSCNPREQSLVGASSCEIYIGVYCSDTSGVPANRDESGCSYSLKVYSEYGMPHMLVDGVPQKDVVMETKVIHYFMPVEVERDYLYIAATADKGDVNVYVSFTDQNKKNEELALPTTKSYIKKSKGIAHSQVVHFSKKELIKKCSEFAECMALVTVEGKGNLEKNHFTLVAYTRIQRLTENTPIVGKVEKNAMIYYTYKSLCEDCTLIISASSFSVDADIDLFINIGHKKDLPTVDSYDVKSTEWFSERIEIDRDNDQVKSKGIKSMKDIFIIGVYAKEDTTISIDVEETTSRIMKLKEGKSVKIEQEPNDMKFFKFEHTSHSNLKFELTSFTGTVEMRINKYSDYQNNDPQHKYLPKDDQTSIWSTHSKQNATINISNEDDLEYCNNCIYLIGIESHSSGAKYLLEVQQVDILSTKQIKLGVPIKDQIAMDDFKQYMFVLDKQKNFRVSVSVYLGKVEYSISADKDFEDVVQKSTNGSIIIEDSDLEDFKEGENVYIRVHGKFEHSEYIVLASHHDSYIIIPDSYTQEITINPYDKEGIDFLYYPPSIRFRLVTQIFSFSGGIEYHVMTKKVYISEITSDNLTFPSKLDHDNYEFNYDIERRMGAGEHRENPERDDEYVILGTIVPKVVYGDVLTDQKKVKFTINMNAHEVSLLSPNLPQEFNMYPEPNNYKYFRFFANGNKNLKIVLTPCVCDVDAYLFNSLDNAYKHYNPMERTRHLVNGEKVIELKNANGPYFLKVQMTSEMEESKYIESTGYCAFQVITYDKEHENYQFSLDQYVAEDNGRVQYWWPNVKRLRFKWGKILKETNYGTVEQPSISNLYVLKKPTLFVNSVCGIKHAVSRGEAELVVGGIPAYEVQINPRKNKFTSTNKYATYVIISTINNQGGAIPFQPVRMYVRIAWYHLIDWSDILIFSLVIGGLLFAAYYYRRKASITQSKLDFEMNDIRNVARVGYAEPEAQNLKRTAPTSGMMEES